MAPCRKCASTEDSARTRGRCPPCYQKDRRNGKFEITKVDGIDTALDMSGARCKCGLRLPCNDCIAGTAADFAMNRMYREPAT
jgi:hypothetical protein